MTLKVVPNKLALVCTTFKSERKEAVTAMPYKYCFINEERERERERAWASVLQVISKGF